MPRTIQLAAVLPAPPERLFDMYLDPKEHAAFTGGDRTRARERGRPRLRGGQSRLGEVLLDTLAQVLGEVVKLPRRRDSANGRIYGCES